MCLRHYSVLAATEGFGMNCNKGWLPLTWLPRGMGSTSAHALVDLRQQLDMSAQGCGCAQHHIIDEQAT
jgi:hypothetical protein